MTIATAADRARSRTERGDLLTCELPAFAAAVLAVLPTVIARFGMRKVFISGVWAALESAGYRITLPMFKLRLVSARAAGLLELARADLVAAMDPELVAASQTHDHGAEYHFVIDRSAAEPWTVDAPPLAEPIGAQRVTAPSSVTGAAS